jgi:Phosphotransferase enzyme family
MAADDLKERTAHAVLAAAGAARELGLDVRTTVIVHDFFSVVVRLVPAPVVVRVRKNLSQDLAVHAEVARQQRELDVAAWLDARGVPVVAPTPLVPRAPVVRDGFAMTFWTAADLAWNHTPYRTENTSHVARLHEALREYPAVDLPFLSPVTNALPTCLDILENTPGVLPDAEVDRLRRDWTMLAPAIATPASFLGACPGAAVQVIHGDAPASNMIRTKTGLRYADFEDICVGPIEWDLAMSNAGAIRSYDAAASRLGLRRVDPGVLSLMTAARLMLMVAAFAFVPQLPLLANALQPSLTAWRNQRPRPA